MFVAMGGPTGATGATGATGTTGATGPQGPAGTYEFVDRGDPAAVDKVKADFITDNTWRDLDLSAIVPAGAKAILIRIHLYGTTATAFCSLRKNGNTNAINVSTTYLYATPGRTKDDVWVIPDSNRLIEYCISNITWTTIELTVGGWVV